MKFCCSGYHLKKVQLIFASFIYIYMLPDILSICIVLKYTPFNFMGQIKLRQGKSHQDIDASFQSLHLQITLLQYGWMTKQKILLVVCDIPSLVLMKFGKLSVYLQKFNILSTKYLEENGHKCNFILKLMAFNTFKAILCCILWSSTRHAVTKLLRGKMRIPGQQTLFPIMSNPSCSDL